MVSMYILFLHKKSGWLSKIPIFSSSRKQDNSMQSKTLGLTCYRCTELGKCNIFQTAFKQFDWISPVMAFWMIMFSTLRSLLFNHQYWSCAMLKSEITSLKKTHNVLLSLTRSLWQHRTSKKRWGEIWKCIFALLMLLRYHRGRKTTLWDSPLSFPCGFHTHWAAFARDVNPKNRPSLTFTSGFLLVLHGIYSKSTDSSYGSLRHPLQLFDLQDDQGDLRIGICEGQGPVILFLLAVGTTRAIFSSHFSAKLLLKLKGHQDLGPIKAQRSISSQEWYTDPSEEVIKAPNQRPLWAYNEWCLYSDHFLACACKRCRSFISFCSFQLKWQNEVHTVVGMSPFH